MVLARVPNFVQPLLSRLKLNLLSEAALILPLRLLAPTFTYRIATPVITRNGYRLPMATFFPPLTPRSALVLKATHTVAEHRLKFRIASVGALIKSGPTKTGNI